MKQKKKLLILAGVLVVMCLAYVGITSQRAAQEEAEAEVAAQEAADSIIYLAELEETDIVSISWTYYTDLAFDLVDEVWVYSEDTSIPIDQTLLEAIISAYEGLIAERELVGAESLEAYGLDDDTAYAVTLTDADGNDTVFYVGNAAEDGNYYLTMGDKSSVYTVTSTVYSTTAYTITDMVVDDTFDTATSDVMESVDITAGEETFTYTADDEGVFDTMATGLSSLSFTSCVDANGSEELDLYGLDEESRTTWYMEYYVETEVTSEDGEETTTETYDVDATLYIGTFVESEALYYVQVEDSNLVYTMDQETVDMLLNIYVEE